MISADTQPTRSRRTRRIAIGAAAGLLSVGVLAPVGMAFSMEQTARNNIVQKPLLPSQAGLGPSLTRPESAGDSRNILFVGNEVKGTKAASIVLAHISDDRQRVDLVRFPRTLQAGKTGRTAAALGATYTAKGSPALVQGLEKLVGVPVDNVAETDIHGVKGMVDALGSIQVETAGGTTTMNGDDALTYISDAAQNANKDASAAEQDAVLRGILLKLAEPSTLANPSTLSSFTDAATRNLTTDESFAASDVRNLAISLRDVRSEDVGSVTATRANLPAIGQALKNDDLADLTD